MAAAAAAAALTVGAAAEGSQEEVHQIGGHARRSLHVEGANTQQVSTRWGSGRDDGGRGGGTKPGWQRVGARARASTPCYHRNCRNGSPRPHAPAAAALAHTHAPRRAEGSEPRCLPGRRGTRPARALTRGRRLHLLPPLPLPLPSLLRCRCRHLLLLQLCPPLLLLLLLLLFPDSMPLGTPP